MSALASDPEPPCDDRHEHDQRDRELFAAWHAGDGRAGNKLVDHYFARLRVYFIGRAQGEHEDLVQETFTRLLAKYEDYQEGSFRAFLFGIARLVFFEFLRRRYRLQNIDPWTDSLTTICKGSMSSRLAKRENHRVLLDALGMLSLEDQDLLELYHWQRLTARELGGMFGVSEGTIRSRIRATLLRLGKCFGEVAGRSHSIEYGVEELETWLTELRGVLKRSKLEAD